MSLVLRAKAPRHQTRLTRDVMSHGVQGRSGRDKRQADGRHGARPWPIPAHRMPPAHTWPSASASRWSHPSSLTPHLAAHNLGFAVALGLPMGVGLSAASGAGGRRAVSMQHAGRPGQLKLQACVPSFPWRRLRQCSQPAAVHLLPSCPTLRLQCRVLPRSTTCASLALWSWLITRNECL